MMLKHFISTYQVLAMGSLLPCVEQFSLVMVNFVRPVAPTRLAKPPSGTRELDQKRM